MYFNKIGNRPISNASIAEVPFDRACSYYDGWMRPVLAEHNINLIVNKDKKKLRDAIGLVCPFVNGPPYRRVFVELNRSQTLYFDNHINGGTVVPVSSILSKHLDCNVIHIMDYEPHETSLMFELYQSSPFSVRSISWIDDGGGLECLSSGDRQPEEVAVFPEPLQKLSSNILCSLASAFGCSLDWDIEKQVRYCVFDEKFTQIR